jgi:hypothetical protein
MGRIVLTGRIRAPRPRAFELRRPPPATASPAFPATAALRGRTAGFVSTRRSRRYPPRGLPSPGVHRRARGSGGEAAELGAARRSSAAGSKSTVVFTWSRRSFGRRAAACGASAAAKGCAGRRSYAGGFAGEAANGGAVRACDGAATGGRRRDGAWTADQRMVEMLGGARRSRGELRWRSGERWREEAAERRRRSGE